MALIKAAARLIVREHSRYRFAGPALCLGVPDIYLTHAELRSAHGLDDGAAPSDERIDARAFFDALGISDLVSIDIPGSVHAPDLIHDLNTPLPSEMAGRFSLVVDPGTTEHVFDMRAAFTNVVSALAVGGVVIHFVPIYSYNGGYFSINPNVLFDLYEANGFSDLRGYVIMWDRYRPFAGRSRVYPYGAVMHARHALADGDQVRHTPHVLFFARKQRVVDRLAIPVQHDHAEARPRTAPDRLARRVLGDGLTTFLIAVVRRRIQLWRSRRQSFWI